MRIIVRNVRGRIAGTNKEVAISAWHIGDDLVAPWKHLNRARMSVGEQTSHQPLELEVQRGTRPERIRIRRFEE